MKEAFRHAKNPVGDPAFWRMRVFKTFATGGMLHQCVFDDSYELWNWIQGEYAGLLKEYLWRGAQHWPIRVLDAGCGYGALLDCFQQAGMLDDVEYTGVDLSPDLIELARWRYPSNSFWVFNLADLTAFSDGAFDWAVMRSVDGMVKESLGEEAWAPCHAELRRVAGRIFSGGLVDHVGDPIPFEIEVVR